MFSRCARGSGRRGCVGRDGHSGFTDGDGADPIAGQIHRLVRGLLVGTSWTSLQGGVLPGQESTSPGECTLARVGQGPTRPRRSENMLNIGKRRRPLRPLASLSPRCRRESVTFRDQVSVFATCTGRPLVPHSKRRSDRRGFWGRTGIRWGEVDRRKNRSHWRLCCGWLSSGCLSQSPFLDWNRKREVGRMIFQKMSLCAIVCHSFVTSFSSRISCLVPDRNQPSQNRAWIL